MDEVSSALWGRFENNSIKGLCGERNSPEAKHILAWHVLLSGLKHTLEQLYVDPKKEHLVVTKRIGVSHPLDNYGSE